MGNLDQISAARRGQPAQHRGGGGTLDRISAHRSGGGTGVPAGVPAVSGVPLDPSAPPVATHKGGGGLLGALGGGAHWVASKADLAAHDIKGIYGGLKTTGEATVHDFAHPKKGIGELFDYANGRRSSAPDSQLYRLLVKPTAASIKETAKHPLRDPFATAMTFLPVLDGLGEGVARAGAAADAARAGEGASGALRAAKENPMPPRMLRSGDKGEETPLQQSGRPGMRLVQAAHDRVVQKALDEKPAGKLAAYGQKRIGMAQDEAGRVQQRMRTGPAEALDKAAKRLTSKTSKVQGRLHQAALELTSVNTSPEDAAAYHLAQAEKGVEPVRNRVVAKLYKTVADRGLLTKNPDGDVIVNETEHPQLAEADRRLAKVQGRGDEILARYSVRTPEQLQQAANAPGRYRAGATYEAPTPGKLGVPSQALLKARSRVERLQTLHDRVSAKAAEGNFSAAQKKILGDLRPASDEEAVIQAKLDAANKQVAALRKKLPADSEEVQAKVREKTAWQKLQIARGDMEKAATGLKGATVPSPDEIAARIETLRGEVAAARGTRDPELVKALNRAQATANKLRTARKATEKGSRLDSAGVAYTSTGKRLEPIGYARAQKLGAALSVAKDELQRLEQQHIARQKPVGIIGGETARPARGHISYASSEKKAPTSPAAASPGPVVGEAKPPITNHVNTGYNIEHGLVPEDVTGQASRHFRGILRFVNTTERRNAAIRTGSDVRRSNRDVLVRVPGAEHAKLTKAVEEALGKSKPTTDDIAGLHAALNEYRHGLVPGLADDFAKDSESQLGTTAADAAAARGLDAPEGYKWVDKGALGELAKAKMGQPGWIGRKLNTVNSAVTAATVYFKVGHIGTRVLTNAATNIIQGSATPAEIGRSVKLWQALSDEDKARALAASGQHSIQALPHEGTGMVARAASRGANWWARRVDSPFRFNAIAYEARKAGFDTPEKFQSLLDKLDNPHEHNMSAAERSKVMGVANRANREAIAYDRLSDFEKRYITRAFWFYPWTSAATRFAVNTVLEHPYKAAALANAGVQGRKTQQALLGDVPSYEDGLIPMGGGKVADFSTFSPLATSADVIQAAARPKNISGFLNPVYAGADSLIHGTDQFGSPSKSPIKDALATVISPAPEGQLLSGYLNRNKPQNRKMFPADQGWYGLRGPALRALLGPGLPRKYNPVAGHSAAARERAGR